MRNFITLRIEGDSCILCEARQFYVSLFAVIGLGRFRVLPVMEVHARRAEHIIAHVARLRRTTAALYRKWRYLQELQ
jgi:hypothetical protein